MYWVWRDQNWNKKILQEHRQLQPEISFHCIFCKKKGEMWRKTNFFDVGLKIHVAADQLGPFDF